MPRHLHGLSARINGPARPPGTQAGPAGSMMRSGERAIRLDFRT